MLYDLPPSFPSEELTFKVREVCFGVIIRQTLAHSVVELPWVKAERPNVRAVFSCKKSSNSHIGSIRGTYLFHSVN